MLFTRLIVPFLFLFASSKFPTMNILPVKEISWSRPGNDSTQRLGKLGISFPNLQLRKLRLRTIAWGHTGNKWWSQDSVWIQDLWSFHSTALPAFFFFSPCSTKEFRQIIKKHERALARVALLVGASFCTAKGWGFNSQPGHIFRLQVQSPVQAHMGGNQSMFLFHIDVSLSLHPFLSL